MIKMFGLFKHYKGKYYLVTGIVKYSEDPSKEFVVYRQLYGDFQKWIRPKSMFLENHNNVPRFKLIIGKF